MALKITEVDYHRILSARPFQRVKLSVDDGEVLRPEIATRRHPRKGADPGEFTAKQCVDMLEAYCDVEIISASDLIIF